MEHSLLDIADAIDRFRGPLVGLIISWGTPHVDAMELAQDSFADAYLDRQSCRGDWTDPEIFGRWLRGVAKNKYRNWRRSQRRRERRVVTVDSEILEATAARDMPHENPRLLQLREAIDSLPAKQQAVVMMHYLEETSVKEVAALLSVTPKTVEGRLYQARRALKRMMERMSPVQIGKALLL